MAGFVWSEPSDQNPNGNWVGKVERTSGTHSSYAVEAHSKGAASANGYAGSAHTNGHASANGHAHANGSNAGASRIRVAILDASPLFSEGLARILEAVPGIQVVGVALTREALFLLLGQVACDVLVLDEASCGAAGAGAFQQLFAPGTAPKVLKLLGSNTNGNGNANGNGHATPFKGFRTEIPKSTTPSEFIRAIRALSDAGDASRSNLNGGQTSPIEDLSPREIEVLRMVTEGRRAREIGEVLNISHKTVATHKLRVMRKLGVTRHSELVRLALRHGLGVAQGSDAEGAV